MIESWNVFFHSPVDLTSLALFRILIGILLLADCSIYSRRAELLLDPEGLLPAERWRSGPDRHYVSLLRFLPDRRIMVRLVLVLYGLSAVGVGLGFYTRASAALALLCAVSIHFRNRHALHSGDVVLRLMTFLLAFSPAGDVWSIDSVLWPDSVHPSSPWALRLMQLQMTSLYFHAFRFKLPGKTWREGSATHYATHLLAHRRRSLPPLLRTPLAHRAATYTTLLAEFGGATLVWFPQTRYAALTALAALHLSLAYFMRMHLFQWTMLASLVVFVPGEDIARLTSSA